jgi:glycosyltransferase involved in cell wall biosynthesis
MSVRKQFVSVIVPTNNRPRFLRDALASIRAQTFKDYEIIVVSDERDPTNSKAVADMFGCNRFIVIDPSPYRNVSAARNIGVDHAQADWIAFLDDDDIWLPTKLQRQLEAAQKGFDLIACDALEFWADGTELIKRPRCHDGWSYTKTINHFYWWASPSVVLMKKSAFESVGGFDTTLRYAEDTELWRRVSWESSICQMEEVLVWIRRGDHQAMADKNERTRNLYELKALLKMYHDTPVQHRKGLPGTNIIYPRIVAITAPMKVLAILHSLTPRSRWLRFKRSLRPRTRINALLYKLYKTWLERWEKRAAKPVHIAPAAATTPRPVYNEKSCGLGVPTQVSLSRNQAMSNQSTTFLDPMRECGSCIAGVTKELANIGEALHTVGSDGLAAKLLDLANQLKIASNELERSQQLALRNYVGLSGQGNKNMAHGALGV